MIKKVFVLFAAFAVLAGSSVAAEFTVGAGVGAISSPYRGQDIKLLPEPYLEIDSKYFYISFPFQANTPLAPSAGIHLINTSPFTLNVKGSFMKDQLEPDDNDNGDMRLLDKRKASLGGGIDITARHAFGIFSREASMDILGTNTGMVASAA